MSEYVTVEELAQYTGADTLRDAATLTDATAAASDAVSVVCGRTFTDAGSVSARTFEAADRYTTIVNDFSTTTGLVVKTDDDDDGTFETTWATSDYELFPANGVVSGISGFPYWKIRAVGDYLFPVSQSTTARTQRVQVTAQWGWAAVPALVKQATLIVGAEIWKRKDAPFGVAGFGEFGSIRVSSDVARQARSLLTAFVRPTGIC